MDINISDKELDRDMKNIYLDPDKDQHIPLEDDEYFHKIYGKERWEKIKSDRAERGKTKESSR